MVSSGVPLDAQDLGTRRVLVDGIGVISGLSVTPLRQSDGVRNDPFRTESEGDVGEVGTDLRHLPVSSRNGVFVGYTILHIGDGCDETRFVLID